MIMLEKDQHGLWNVPGLCELDPSSDQVVLDRTIFPDAAKQIIFGRGSGAKQLANTVAKIPSGVFVVVGASSCKTQSIQAVLGSLFKSAAKAHIFEVQGHADHQAIRGGIEALHRSQTDQVIVIGGGTTLDVGKAIAGLANQEGGQEIAPFQTGERTINPIKTLPWIAVPTTSGTGSESTNNAVVELGEEKRSIRNLPPPSLIIADPILTDSLPFTPTVVALVDALAQSFEVITHTKASPAIQAVALAAILNLTQGLKVLVENGEKPPATYGIVIDAQIRAILSWGSLLMGIAFAHAGLGLPHALVHFCNKFGLSHGHMVGILLVPGLQVQALHDPLTAIRLARVKQALSGAELEHKISLNFEEVEEDTVAPLDPGSEPNLGWLAAAISKLFAQAGLATSLSQAGLSLTDLDWIAAQEHTLGASYGISKRRATKDELRAVLQKAWSKHNL